MLRSSALECSFPARKTAVLRLMARRQGPNTSLDFVLTLQAEHRCPSPAVLSSCGGWQGGRKRKGGEYAAERSHVKDVRCSFTLMEARIPFPRAPSRQMSLPLRLRGCCTISFGMALSPCGAFPSSLFCISVAPFPCRLRGDFRGNLRRRPAWPPPRPCVGALAMRQRSLCKPLLILSPRPCAASSPARSLSLLHRARGWSHSEPIRSADAASRP